MRDMYDALQHTSPKDTAHELQDQTFLYKLFAFDYDGVFTNGTVYLMPDSMA